jgi:hypothetical protein
MQSYPIGVCRHAQYPNTKFRPCEKCDAQICYDCLMINDSDQTWCKNCFRNEYPDDFKYVYNIPDAKDISPVKIVLTQSKLDKIKENFSLQGNIPVIARWSHKRIIDCMRQKELRELKMIPSKFEACSKPQNYITSDGSLIELDDGEFTSGSMKLQFTDPFDVKLHKFLGELKSKNIYFVLKEIFPSRTDINERMLLVEISSKRITGESNNLKYPFNKKIGQRVITAHI